MDHYKDVSREDLCNIIDALTACATSMIYNHRMARVNGKYQSAFC